MYMGAVAVAVAAACLCAHKSGAIQDAESSEHVYCISAHASVLMRSIFVCRHAVAVAAVSK
jgi:hypothetical protein